MIPQEAIPILERLQEPEAWEPQISRDAYEALELAIEALEDRDKQSASGEQVGKDIKFPTIHCCREYDSIQDESGRMGFGVYDPKEKNIYIAGDVPKEIFLKALFHEVFHWVQDVAEMKFDEDDANSFSDILYDAVDVFDGRGPELFGQKTIVEPGEMFVGDKVLKEALNDQFRDTTKKTDDDTISRAAAIDAVKKNTFRLTFAEEQNCEGHVAWSANAVYSDVMEGVLLELPSAQPERTCINCGRTANNGGWYADGRTRCPIEEHYALPKDGYCHLWEKRNFTDDDYPERREE